jgi:hypothetical protein
MTLAEEVQSETLTLLLASEFHKFLPAKERAKKIRKTAKVICQRVRDKPTKEACRRIRNEKNDLLIIKALDNALFKYFELHE